MNNQSPPKGPREIRLDWLWNQIWQTHASGDVHEYFLALADANLASFRAILPANDQAAAEDLRKAEDLHLSQSRHFKARLDRIEVSRMDIVGLREIYVRQVGELAATTNKILTLANGAVALGALAFMSDSSSDEVRNLTPVLYLASAGFLLIGIPHNNGPAKSLHLLASPNPSQ